MQIPKTAITFVIQGPVVPDVTKDSCSQIREHFPGATIILSTWKEQSSDGLDVDELLLNDDPGGSIVKYDKRDRAHTVNINRQIRSTIGGLQKVVTTYAVKLRSDNTLSSDQLLSFYQQYPSAEHRLIPLSKRILTTNMFAKEYIEGLPTPFFFSDFFMFGLTEDLIAFWDQPFLTDYVFNSQLSGKRQHADYPWPQLHIEQLLVTNFLSKYVSLDFPHKYANSNGQLALSRELIAKHFIVMERSQIDLSVPNRLNQHEGFPYETYSYKRWQQLYKQHCDDKLVIPNHLSFKLRWLSARLLMFIKSGIKQKVRLLVCLLKKTKH